MATRYTKTTLKGYTLRELLDLAEMEGLPVPVRSNKTVVLRSLFDHFAIENNASISAREVRLLRAHVDGFKHAVAKADRDTESIIGIMLQEANNPIKLEFDMEINDKMEDEIVKKMCGDCQKKGKEIKDYKPDFYAKHYLAPQLLLLKKNSTPSKIKHPLFEGLHDYLSSWILSARLERILEGTYSPNPGSTGQNKEEFLIFRAYFTKKHKFTDSLWELVQNCLSSICGDPTMKKPGNKEEFVDICNSIRLSCQRVISNKLALIRCGSCEENSASSISKKPITIPSPINAIHVVYEDHAPKESLEWECQMKDATIGALREQLKLLQQQFEEQNTSIVKTVEEDTPWLNADNWNIDYSNLPQFASSDVDPFSSGEDFHCRQTENSFLSSHDMDWESNDSVDMKNGSFEEKSYSFSWKN